MGVLLFAHRVFEEARWHEEEHPLELDGLMFQLVIQIGLAAIEKLWNRLADRKVEESRALGIDEALQEYWVDDFLNGIWEGKLEEVLERLRELYEQTNHNRLDRLIRHLERFLECLHYETCEPNGWPIRSGEVETAHKYLLQDRLKLPGTCWNEERFNPMLAIRVIKKNGWWVEFWNWRIKREEQSA